MALTKIPSTLLETSGHLVFGDNEWIKMGASNDLLITHDGSSSYIIDNGSGGLTIAGSGVYIKNAAYNEQMISAVENGAVELYHDNSKKLETTSTGVKVLGNITNASGDLTLDVGGDINLDAGGANINFNDDGTSIGHIEMAGQNLEIKSKVADKDIIFKGNDNGTAVTALTLDMSAAGAATFNSDVVVGGNLTVSGTSTTLNTATLDVEDKNITVNKGSGDTSGSADGAGLTIQDAVDASNDATMLWNASADKFVFSHPINSASYIEATGNISTGANAGRLRAGGSNEMQLYFDGSHGHLSSSTGNFTVDAAGDITLDAGGGDILFKDDGTLVGTIGGFASNNMIIKSEYSDGDVIIQGNDGGSGITALTLDMSDAGYAYFNSGIDVAAAASRRLRFTDADGTFRAGIQAVDTGGQMIGTTAQHDFAIRSQSNLLFSSGGNTERMRIASSSGNVGIGTASPSTALHILGSSTSRNTIVSNVTIDGGTAVGYPYAGYGFGIDFKGKDYGNTAIREYGRIIAHMTNQTSQTEAGDAGFKSALSFYTNTGGASSTAATEKMTISAEGNVGIGTISPSAPLHVTRTASGYPILKLTQNGADQYNTIYLQNSDSTAATVVMGTGGGSVGNGAWANSAVFGTTSDAKVVLLQNDSAAVTIDTDQNVGIGTSSPDGELHVKSAGNADVYVERTSGAKIHLQAQSALGNIGTSSNHDLGLMTNASVRMRITTTGDVLVGTNSAVQGTGHGIKLTSDDRLYMVNALTSGEQISYYGNGGYKYYVGVNGKIHSAFGQAVYAVSDERLKENIRDYDKGLADIVKLKPRLFDWKEGEGSNEKNVSGFVAQECEEAGFDEFVGDFKHDTLTDAKSFGQGGLIPALVKAIQEQQTIIEDLKARIETLEG